MGFNKSPGAYVDTQYPDTIVDDLGVKTSDMMNIYAIHRMRNMEPNYIQMKVAGVSVASFYTGFSYKHYVGKPDFAITVFLSDQDNPPSHFEGMLRKIAYDLLPQRDDLLFDQILVNYYERLEYDEIEPYWEEYLEGEGSKIATIQSDVEDEVKEESNEPAVPQFVEMNFAEQFEKFEKDELKAELKNLQSLLKEKTEKIRALTNSITDLAGKSDFSNEVNMLKSQLDEANQRLDDWSLKIADINEKNVILMETVRKLTEMSIQQNEEMERHGREIIDLKKQLKSKDDELEDLNQKMIETATSSDKTEEFSTAINKLNEKVENLCQEKDGLQEENERLSVENGALLQSIANLKIELKGLSETVDIDNGAQDHMADQIIDLKKEIKVLRREKNHYRNIVKEHDLL